MWYLYDICIIIIDRYIIQGYPRTKHVITDIANGVYGDDVYTVSQGTETYQVPIADPNDLYETYDAVTDIVTNNPLAKKRPPPAFSNCWPTTKESSYSIKQKLRDFVQSFYFYKQYNEYICQLLVMCGVNMEV